MASRRFFDRVPGSALRRRPVGLTLAARGLAVALALAGGTGHAADAPVLMRGPAHTVTTDDVRAAIQLVPRASREAVLSRPQQVQQLVEGIYLRRVLAAEAEKARIDQEPVVQQLVRQSRERLLSDAQLTEIMLKALPADAAATAQARDLYRSNPERFRTPEQARARHVLVAAAPDAKAKADALLARIKAGESFEAVAKAESADLTTAAGGGDLGWFAAGAMVPAFEQALAELRNAGETAGPVETPFGWHLIRLEGRRPAGVRPFEDVREALEQEVKAKAQDVARTEALQRLMQDAKLDVEALGVFTRTPPGPN